jgi:hypothetical protein
MKDQEQSEAGPDKEKTHFSFDLSYEEFSVLIEPDSHQSKEKWQMENEK